MKGPIRVLLVDDCPTLRTGLRQVFQRVPDVVVVAEAGDGKAALAHIESLHPDVVLLDCQLPGMEGTAVAAAVQRMCLQTSILAFSAYDDEEYVRGMPEAGAVGYALKDEAPERVVEAVRAVARGQGWFSPQVAARIAKWTQREKPGSPQFTERELAVLRLVAKGKSNRQIADGLCLSHRTVRFHLQNICDKIGVKLDREVVVWAIQHGLRGKKPLSARSGKAHLPETANQTCRK